jgi:YD repeat-containing protein
VTREDNETGATYEGFEAYAPDGTVYVFDKLRKLAVPPTPYLASQHRLKYETYMMVSKVTDRFGNWVEYVYDDASRLTKIHANDGREINLTYLADAVHDYNIDTITANGRVWQYQYEGEYSTSRHLTTVIRPDERKWQFGLNHLSDRKPTASMLNGCGTTNMDPTTYNVTITHPNGATGTFGIKETLHGAVNIDANVAWEAGSQVIPRCTSHMSLVQKTLSGPGLDTKNWTYQYSQNKGTLAGDSINSTHQLSDIQLPVGLDRSQYKTTTVYAPDSSITRYFYEKKGSGFRS